MVDSDRRRIALTAKKTIVDSNLPIISKMEDAKPGTITHAVVFKVYDKHILVEFYNNLKALVPAKEARYVIASSQKLILDHSLVKLLSIILQQHFR